MALNAGRRSELSAEVVPKPLEDEMEFVIEEEKTVGILGGMGPLATVELFKRIVQKTPARKDQEHLRIIIDNNPKIPDRTQAILHEGEDPLPFLQETARNLERAGADFIVIPCNTAHYYLEDIRAAVSIPVWDMIEATVAAIKQSKVGLLSTDTTLQIKLYQKPCEARGIHLLQPPYEEQSALMRAIYQIKGGRNDSGLKATVIGVAHRLEQLGARALIIGCTELSLILSPADVTVPIYDALDILAQKVVELAKIRRPLM